MLKEAPITNITIQNLDLFDGLNVNDTIKMEVKDLENFTENFIIKENDFY